MAAEKAMILRTSVGLYLMGHTEEDLHPQMECTEGAQREKVVFHAGIFLHDGVPVSPAQALRIFIGGGEGFGHR